MKAEKVSLFRFLVFLAILAVVSYGGVTSISQWCPSDTCNSNHCGCTGPYIESIGVCCFTCWMWYPRGCTYPGDCDHMEIFECCGINECEELNP